MLKALASRFADHVACLVTPEQNSVFDANLDALSKHKDIEAMMEDMASEGYWLDPESYMARYRPYSVKDGILTIPVKGVLLHDFPWAAGWATGYTYIWEAFKRGMADPDVRGIALHCHTPGGEVAGCFELVDRMYAMRGQKPIQGFAHEYAYSAGYAIISVCDKITVSQTGGVGSIGVVTSHVDMSKLYDDIGMKITFIHFGKHKVDGNSYEPLSASVKSRIQARIDASGEIFVAKMARNRGMSEKAIRDTEALTYTASEAKEVGLADEIGPLDDAMTAFIADLSTEQGDDQMTDKTTATVTAEQTAALETARAEGFAAGLAKGTTDGATAERGRITAIVNSEEGKKRPKAAVSLAMKSGIDAETANSVLADLAEEAAAVATPAKTDDKKDDAKTNGQTFDASMENGKPKVGGNDEVKTDEEKANSSADILDLAGAAGIPGLRKRTA